MKLKKIPYRLLLLLLTGGASLIIGLLSFSGMFALYPVLSVALSSFVLSWAFEGEIYYQNIRGALNKLMQWNYLPRVLANRFLLEHFPLDKDPDTWPQFLRDYHKQLLLLHHFEHKAEEAQATLDKDSKNRKEHALKKIKTMEKWFAKQLFATKGGATTPYAQELRQWLALQQTTPAQNAAPEAATAQVHATLAQRRWMLPAMKAFCGLSGVFMSLGTTYLLLEAFEVIPALAALSASTLPLVITPMAVIAGTAYALLTYNTMTDLVINETLQTWGKKISTKWRESESLKEKTLAVGIAFAAFSLSFLALALTFCTAGTWWTVVKETPPLFAWMGRMPGFVMGVISPLVNATSALAFNLQNSSETLEIVYTQLEKGLEHLEQWLVHLRNAYTQYRQGNPQPVAAERTSSSQPTQGFFSRLNASVQDQLNHLAPNENGWQLINPFRLVLKLTIMPLRIILFLGHLVSIGVTTDRVPGISQIYSTILGIISEGFEDAHYFVNCHHGHAHPHGAGPHQHGRRTPEQERTFLTGLLEERLRGEHGHSHEMDIPTWVLKGLFSPVYALAAAWDRGFSLLNDKAHVVQSLTDAWNKQHGYREVHVDYSEKSQLPSSAWQMEHMLHALAHYQEKHVDAAYLKSPSPGDVALAQLETDVRAIVQQDSKDEVKLAATLEKIRQETQKPVYEPGFFAFNKTPAEVLQELPRRAALRSDAPPPAVAACA